MDRGAWKVPVQGIAKTQQMKDVFSYQRRPPEAKLKEPEKLIKKITWDKIKQSRPYTHPNFISSPSP